MEAEFGDPEYEYYAQHHNWRFYDDIFDDVDDDYWPKKKDFQERRGTCQNISRSIMLLTLYERR